MSHCFFVDFWGIRFPFKNLILCYYYSIKKNPIGCRCCEWTRYIFICRILQLSFKKRRLDTVQLLRPNGSIYHAYDHRTPGMSQVSRSRFVTPCGGVF